VCSKQDPLAYFKKSHVGIIGFSQKETGTRVLPWQQHRRYHSVSFAMHIFAGAKSEEHCLNISSVILD